MYDGQMDWILMPLPARHHHQPETANHPHQWRRTCAGC